MTNPPQDQHNSGAYAAQPMSTGGKPRRLRRPLSIVLVIACVLAVGVAALLGGELYMRHRANSVVAEIAECEVNDQASVSFGARPLLLQAIAGSYSGISIQTAGNQIRQAKGMKVDLHIDDLHVQNTSNSRGTIGSLDAAITWSSNGIKQSLQESVPLFGAMVRRVTTDPTNGTIQLQASLGSITARPRIADGALALEIVDVTWMGSALPREAAQPTLGAFTSQAKKLPMGIHADSVEVTSSGLASHWSTRSATIPREPQDRCLTGLE